MKHPALVRVFAVVLVVMCLVMLLAGVYGMRSAAKERMEGQQDLARLSNHIEEYRLIRQALEGTISYKEAEESLSARQDQHDEDAAKHKTELATYTATKSGLNEGSATIDAAIAALEEARKQYMAGVEEFDKREKEFLRGLEQFQEGKRQLAEGWAQYNTMNSVLLAAQGQMSGLRAIGDIFADPEIDDAQALQRAVVDAYNGAISAFDQALGIADSVKAQGGISPEQMQMLLSMLEEETGVSLDSIALEGVTAEQLQQVEDSVVEVTGMTPDQIRQSLVQQRDDVASGDAEMLLTPEQFAMVREIYLDNRELAEAGISALEMKLSEYSGQMAETRVQLETAQAEMDKMETVMAQGQAMIEEARKKLQEAGEQIEAGDQALADGQAEIWYQKTKLAEKEQELQTEKKNLDQDAEELGKMSEKTEEQKDLEARETSVRLSLLDVQEIQEQNADGQELLTAAEQFHAQKSTSVEEMYRGRMFACALMLIGALAGFLGLPAAFEKTKNRILLIGPVILCLLCAIAAEILVRRLGLRDSYSALAVAVFAMVQLAFVMPKGKAV